MSFSKRVRRLREQKGLTWYRLAKLCGISKQGLAKLEQPGNDPKLSTLHKLAKALGVSLDELAGEGREEKSKRTKKRN